MPWSVVGPVAGAVVSSALAPDPPDSGMGSAQQQERLAGVEADNAQSNQAFWNANYKPVEAQLATTAAGTGTPADQELYAGKAHGDVSQGYAQANKDLISRISSYGINPSSPRAQTEMAQVSLAQGAADASAQNNARLQREQLGFSRQTDAAQIGRGLQANSSAQLSAAATGMGQAAGNEANINAINTGLHNQAVSNVGYAVAPAFNAARSGISNWWNSSGTGNNPSPNANTGGSGSVDTVPYGGYSAPSADYAGGTTDVRGPGTTTSDSVPAHLSKHEAVLNAGAARIVGKERIRKLNIAGMVAMHGTRGHRPKPANIGTHLASMGV